MTAPGVATAPLAEPCPLLSIVVFTRDDAAHLGRCLETMIAEPPSAAFEVLVVDNASSDSTPNVVAEAARNGLPVLRIGLPVETSFSAGNNLGLRQARGEVVLLLNPDTLPRGPVVDRCLAVLRADPGLGLVSPRLRHPDGSSQATGWRLPVPMALAAEHAGSVAREIAPGSGPLTRVGWLMGCFLMGRREAILRLGGFDEAFWFAGTDLELCARMDRSGLANVRVEDVEVVHAGHLRWDARRRKASHDALVRWLRRDFGPLPARLVRAAAALAEIARR